MDIKIIQGDECYEIQRCILADVGLDYDGL